MRGEGSARALGALTRLRVRWYRRAWSCAHVVGEPTLVAPALLAGAGMVHFHDGVTLGWEGGPGFHSVYTYIEARRPGSVIEIGAGSFLNNGVALVSEGEGEAGGIRVGARVLIGPGVSIVDSDFHGLGVAERHTGTHPTAPVIIEDDVFIGPGVRVLKGVRLGRGCVVGAGAVVSRDIPAGAVAAGNPARVTSG